MTDMTDKDLVSYTEIHADTPRALFSVAHARRLASIAGMEDEYVIPDEGFVQIRNHENPALMERLRQVEFDDNGRATAQPAAANQTRGPVPMPR